MTNEEEEVLEIKDKEAENELMGERLRMARSKVEELELARDRNFDAIAAEKGGRVGEVVWWKAPGGLFLKLSKSSGMEMISADQEVVSKALQKARDEYHALLELLADREVADEDDV